MRRRFPRLSSLAREASLEILRMYLTEGALDETLEDGSRNGSINRDCAQLCSTRQDYLGGRGCNLTATLIGIAPGIAIYVYFGIFGKGLGSGPSFFDWVLFGLGVLATITLAILVIRKTKTKFAEENPT
jgi:hypothetical protein